MTARIAMCADDFGLDADIGRGVFGLAERGRISAASCLVGGAHWRSAAREVDTLRALGIEVGLHLDLTEAPLDRSMRRSLPRLIVACHARAIGIEALRREVRDQIDAFEQMTGHAPDYIDGHQHVHQLPQVRDALFDVLLARSARPWLRSTRRPATLQAPSDAGWSERYKDRIVQALGGKVFAARAQALGLRTNEHLLGVYALAGTTAHYCAWLHAWLAAACDGDLLVCHPAQPGGSTGADDPIRAARLTEYDVISGDAMHAALQAHGVSIVRMGRTHGPHGA